MMGKTNKHLLIGLLFGSSFFAMAGEPLDLVNAAVDEQALTLDQNYGLLLSGQERNNLKIKLVVEKVAAELAADNQATVKAKVDEAVVTYEISDPVDQRQLLIEVEAAASSGGGSGNRPPCCG